MPIEGKQKYIVYLTEKEVDFLRGRMAKGPGSGGLSALLDAYVCKLARGLRDSGARLDGKVSLSRALRLLKSVANNVK